MEHTIKVEIVINIENTLISDLHETISSILAQSNLEILDISLRIINSNNLNIQSEKNRLVNTNIHLVKKPTNARFVLSLTSGEIISSSYLYKGVHFLLNNQSAFVCPEYTLQRIENTLVIATIKNDKMLFNKAYAKLIDYKKISSSSVISPRAQIIKDACSVLSTTYADFFSYVHQIKEREPHFDSSLFSPKHFINNTPPPIFQNTAHFKSIRKRIISFIKTFSGRSKILKKFLEPSTNNPRLFHSKISPYISPQMRNEIEQLSNIKFGLKGYMSMKFIDLTYETFLKSEQLFSAYATVINKLDSSSYSYVMILPWLISGGVDLFAINYLNTISKLCPDQNILVILTNGAHHSFSKKQLNLASNITLLDLPLLLKANKPSDKALVELIYSMVNILCPRRLHIIASKVGYDCLAKYGEAIRSQDIKILFSSYNYLTGPHGEYTGYSVQELPIAYRPGDIITTDNPASKELWVKHFGIISDDILVHNQLFDIPKNILKPSSQKSIKILWAAHIRPEKNPEILPLIAERLQKNKIEIDCYGLFSPMNWPNGDNPLNTNIANLHYMGPYNNFFKDIKTSEYSLFLYTSHTDGTPNVVIEAALAKLPIVASKIGGIPDALGDDANLVEDTHSPEQFIDAIHKTLSNLSSAQLRTEKLYNKLVVKHSASNFETQVKEMLERSK